MVVEELVAILGWDIRGEENLKRFNNDLRAASQQMDRFTTRVVEAGRAAAIAFGAIGGAIGAAFGKSIIDTGAEFEAMTVRLKALEGSAAGAEKALAWITDFAKNTPLELRDATEAYARMRTYGLDPTNGSLQAIVDTMAATGGGAEKLNGIITALGQAWTKQKLQGEEIMQLMERGVPVWDMLSAATGKSVQELQKLSTAGKLGRKEIQLLIDGLGKRFKGASEDYSKTWEGIVAKLRDEWTMFLKEISDEGIFNDVKMRIQGLLDWVSRKWDDGTLEGWAKTISGAFESALDVGDYFLAKFTANFNTLKAIFEDNEGVWKENKTLILSVLAAIGVALFPFTTAVAAAAIAFDDWLAYMRDAPSVLGEVIEAIADFLGVEPERVAEALEKIAKAAGMLFFASVAVGVFSKAIRSLHGALLLLVPLKWMGKWLAGLAGIKWGATAAGAGAAGAAGTAAAGAGASGWLSGAARLFAGWGAVLAAMPGLFTGNQIVDIPDEHEPAWMKEIKKEWGQETPNAIRNGNKLLHGALEYIGEKVSDLVTLFTQDASAAPFSGGGGSGGGLYSPSGIPLGGGHQTSYKGGAGKDALMQGVYNAFRSAGYSHEGAKAMVAEVGRENSFRENLVFGSHLDPHNNRRNSGFFSWQKDRGDKLMAFLGARGLVKDGKIQRSQASLDAMAEFTAQEMGRMTPGLLRDLRSGNISYAEANERLGEDYIKWRYNDPRYARHHGYRDQYYARISELTDGEVSQMAQNYSGHARRMSGSGRSLQASIANNNSRSSQVNQTIHVGDIHAAPGERVERATARAVGNAAASAGTKPLARIQQGPASP